MELDAAHVEELRRSEMQKLQAKLEQVLALPLVSANGVIHVQSSMLRTSFRWGSRALSPECLSGDPVTAVCLAL